MDECTHVNRIRFAIIHQRSSTTLVALARCHCGGAFAAEPEFFDVFIARKDGYKSIRIPSVVVTKKGVVLAFAEGRAADSDQAGNDIILKRSRDEGRTWLPLQLIADDGANSLNNPTAVVEQESGRVFLMYQRIPAHMKERDKNCGDGL